MPISSEAASNEIADVHFEHLLGNNDRPSVDAVTPQWNNHVMNRNAAKRHWLVILFVLLVAALGLLAWRLPDNNTFRKTALVLWGVTPTAAAIWQYLYQRVEWHRLAVDRARFWLLDPECSLSISAEFDLVDGRIGYEAAQKALSQLADSSGTSLTNSPGVAIWQIRGMTYRLTSNVAFDPINGEESLLRLDIPVTKRSFRHWPKALDGDVALVLDRVEKAVNPQNKKFVVEIEFPAANPYFGLFVAKVSPSSVKRFLLDFFEYSADEKDVVQVRENSLKIITTSAYAARRLSLHYLALRPIPEAA